MAEIDSKRCAQCGDCKPLTSFYKQGRAGYCIPCEKEYKRRHYQANSSRIKSKSKQWAENNKERKRATNKAYQVSNKEKIAETKRIYQKKNHAACLERARKSRANNLDSYRAREAEYREKNRAACNQRIKEWKKKNPHAIVFYAGKRRSAMLQAVPAWADFDQIALIYKQSSELGRGYHVDHIVPLVSDKVCGLHCHANLQILPASENSRKNNRVWPDMW